MDTFNFIMKSIGFIVFIFSSIALIGIFVASIINLFRSNKKEIERYYNCENTSTDKILREQTYIIERDRAERWRRNIRDDIKSLGD